MCRCLKNSFFVLDTVLLLDGVNELITQQNSYNYSDVNKLIVSVLHFPCACSGLSCLYCPHDPSHLTRACTHSNPHHERGRFSRSKRRSSCHPSCPPTSQRARRIARYWSECTASANPRWPSRATRTTSACHCVGEDVEREGAGGSQLRK